MYTIMTHTSNKLNRYSDQVTQTLRRILLKKSFCCFVGRVFFPPPPLRLDRSTLWPFWLLFAFLPFKHERRQTYTDGEMERLCSPAEVWDEVIDRYRMQEASLEMKSHYSHKQGEILQHGIVVGRYKRSGCTRSDSY